jgi:hypothetical protein
MSSSALHVVFSDAGAVDLRQALVSLGRDDRVAIYPDDLSFGPIAPPDSNGRAQWAMREFGGDDWNELVPMIERFWAEVLSCEGRQIVWWSRREVRGYLGFLDYLRRVGDRACDVIDLTDVMITRRDEHGTVGPKHRAICLGLLRTRDIIDNDLLALATPLTDDARSAYRAEWQRLQQENAPLRIVSPDLTLASVPITYFDAVLLKHVQPRFLKSARIIGEVLGEYWDVDIFNLGDYFLASRLRALDRAGKIESQGNLHRIRYSEVRLPGGDMETRRAIRYRVKVDDNFHFMDEDERTEIGIFDSGDEALAACREVVEKSLRHHYKSGMSAAALFEQYKSFGDDPFIVAEGTDVKIEFSAWGYAESRCPAICGEDGEA